MSPPTWPRGPARQRFNTRSDAHPAGEERAVHRKLDLPTRQMVWSQYLSSNIVSEIMYFVYNVCKMHFRSILFLMGINYVHRHANQCENLFYRPI